MFLYPEVKLCVQLWQPTFLSFLAIFMHFCCLMVSTTVIASVRPYFNKRLN